MIPNILTNPSVSGACVEIEEHFLGRSANADLAEVHGIVLLVFGSDFTVLAIFTGIKLLHQYSFCVNSAPKCTLESFRENTMLSDLLGMEIGTWLRRFEAETA